LQCADRVRSSKKEKERRLKSEVKKGIVRIGACQKNNVAHGTDL